MSGQDFALVFGGLLFAGIAGWLFWHYVGVFVEEQESKSRGTKRHRAVKTKKWPAV